MSIEVKEQDVALGVAELRVMVEKVSDKLVSYDQKIASLGGEDQAKIEKINQALDSYDKKNQELVLSLSRAENEKKSQDERIVNLENQLIKSTTNQSSVKFCDAPQYKALTELVKGWEGSLELTIAKLPQEHKSLFITNPSQFESVTDKKTYLRTDNAEFGGVTVSEPIAREILKKLEQPSPIRSLARVRMTKTKTLNIPIRVSLPPADYEGETETSSSGHSEYSSATMTASRQTTTVPVTRDLLNFSDFNFETEIMNDVAESFAVREGNRFLFGTGVKQPQGLITKIGVGANDISAIETASPTALKLDDVINLYGELKQGYNGVYFFNKKTLSALRVEKSGGQYLWQFGGETFPSQIAGLNYVIMQDMPDIAVDNCPVGLGDFYKGFNILDAIQMEMVRDDVSGKKEAIVEFTWYRWNDARVVLGEAFKFLKVKA